MCFIVTHISVFWLHRYIYDCYFTKLRFDHSRQHIFKKTSLPLSRLFIIDIRVEFMSLYLIIFFLYLFSVLQPVSYSNKTIVLAASHLLIHETLFLFMLSFLSYFPSLYIFFIHFKIILRITYYAIGCLEVSLRFLSSSQCV